MVAMNYLYTYSSVLIHRATEYQSDQSYALPIKFGLYPIKLTFLRILQSYQEYRNGY